MCYYVHLSFSLCVCVCVYTYIYVKVQVYLCVHMCGGWETPVWFMCIEYMVQPNFGCSVCSFLVVLVFSHLPPAALDLSGQIQLSAG